MCLGETLHSWELPLNYDVFWGVHLHTETQLFCFGFWVQKCNYYVSHIYTVFRWIIGKSSILVRGMPSPKPVHIARSHAQCLEFVLSWAIFCSVYSLIYSECTQYLYICISIDYSCLWKQNRDVIFELIYKGLNVIHPVDPLNLNSHCKKTFQFMFHRDVKLIWLHYWH